MPTVRAMRADDWEQVSQLDARAFSAYLRQTGRDIRRDPRSRDNLQAALAMNPAGCFVAEDGKPVGYIFSRIWGRLGWIGVFGVDPDCQGHGIGRTLLSSAVDSLEKSGCTTIGLETMPDSPYNVGLYAKYGFNPVYPTLYLGKAPAEAPVVIPFERLSKLDDADALAHITSLSQAADPDLDCAREARNAKEFGWGDTLLMGWPRPWGFIIVRTVSAAIGPPQPLCAVTSLVTAPHARERLGEALQLLDHCAVKTNASEVLLPVNAADTEALHECLAAGFRVRRVSARMVYRKGYTCSKGINLSRWMM